MMFSLCDIILLAVLVLALVRGWRSGVLRVLSRFGAWVAAFFVARACASWLAWLLSGLFPGLTAAATTGNTALVLSLFCDVEGLYLRLLGLAAFIVVFILTGLLVRYLVARIRRKLKKRPLGAFDRLLGAALSLVAVLAVCLILSQQVFPICSALGWTAPEEWLELSALAAPLLHGLWLWVA